MHCHRLWQLGRRPKTSEGVSQDAQLVGQAGFHGGGNVRSRDKAKQKSEAYPTTGEGEASSTKGVGNLLSG